jgi:folate-binding protein YgfZ
MHYPTESDMPSNLQLELQAIREGAAIAPITDRAFLRVTGSDATRWLNGMVTNNIKDLAPGEGNYNFLLNAQGRIQGDCTIYREPGEGEPAFLLETDDSQLETVRQTLDRFIIMDDVELTKGLQMRDPKALVSEPHGLAVHGLQSVSWLWDEIWNQNEFPFVDNPKPSSMTFGTAGGYPIVILSSPKRPEPYFELWFSDMFHLEKTLRWPRFENAKLVSPEALEAHRILTSTPKYGQDIRNTETHKDLPQETAQTHALHFAKGCYLGQEIVERIRSRGQVHRTFTQFRLTGTLPELPAPLEANGKPTGELTSAIQIGDDLIALGYARREALETHQSLIYPGGTALPTT